MDPDVLKAAIEAGHEYVKRWRKMIGYAGNWQV
jgi:hypothetical protein